VIVKSKRDLSGSRQDVEWGNGTSVRLLVKGDGTPFTVTHTTVRAGSQSHLCYERHLEACYCIAGEGEVIVCDGTLYELKPGVLYSPAKGEAHYLCAHSELHLVCVFLPALEGTERHSLSGHGHSSY
jgi:L-ectoine synthase